MIYFVLCENSTALPILVTILKHVLHGYRRNSFNLQLDGSTACSGPDIHNIVADKGEGTYLVSWRHFGISGPFSFGKKSWWKMGLAVQRTSLCPCHEMLSLKQLTKQISHNKILGCLAPAPQLIYSHNLQVRHVRVVVEMVHSVSNRGGSGLTHKGFKFS